MALLALQLLSAQRIHAPVAAIVFPFFDHWLGMLFPPTPSILRGGFLRVASPDFFGTAFSAIVPIELSSSYAMPTRNIREETVGRQFGVTLALQLLEPFI